VVGSAEIGDIANREMAKTIAGVVIAVDYRLAPETRFPGPIEDCYSALLWLYQNAEKNSVDKHRIGVIGTSAGGGLAAALCLMARDRAEVHVAFQGLFMPMLDSSTPARLEQNPKPHLGQHVWTNQNNRFAWQALLGFDPDSRDVSCYASPAQAEDLSNLPPTYISIGALDLFVEETLDYAKRMIAAGNEVDLHIYAGAPHAYNAIPDAEATQNEHLLLQKALARAFKL
jgi:acetyl esterase/lipase